MSEIKGRIETGKYIIGKDIIIPEGKYDIVCIERYGSLKLEDEDFFMDAAGEDGIVSVNNIFITNGFEITIEDGVFGFRKSEPIILEF